MPMILPLVAFLIYAVTGLKVDVTQLTILISLFVSLVGAGIFRYFIQPSRISLQWQMGFTALLGLWIAYFNWGWVMLFPLCEVIISFWLIKRFPVEVASRWVFTLAMTGLSAAQLYIVYCRYNNLISSSSPDFTGTVMVLTQRLTSISCNLYDGKAVTKSDKTLSSSRKQYAIRNTPTFIEFFSYSFNFFGILAGPLVFYNDFMAAFPSRDVSKNHKLAYAKAPSSTLPVVSKVVGGLLMIVCFWLGSQFVPYKLNIDAKFMAEAPVWKRIVFLYFSLLAVRAKYYGVWLLGDGVYNAAGIGFTGYDEEGAPKWDAVTNINIRGIELASGLKTYIDNWNIMTVKWIRLVAYERVSERYRTVVSFALSAFWHGFFPGYYIMFATCHLYLHVQRKFRRCVRPYFQTSKWRKRMYDFATLLVTQLTLSYAVLPFVVLEWTASIQFYKSFWFVGHVGALALYLALPDRPSPSAADDVTSASSKARVVTSAPHARTNGVGDVTNNGKLRHRR